MSRPIFAADSFIPGHGTQVRLIRVDDYQNVIYNEIGYGMDMLSSVKLIQNVDEELLLAYVVPNNLPNTCMHLACFHDLVGSFCGELGLAERYLTVALPTDITFDSCPNPFNPSTTLAFSLPQDAQASLKVYDIAANLVSTLHEGFTEAGVREISFDASGLASGIYFAQLEAGGYQQTEKLVLQK